MKLILIKIGKVFATIKRDGLIVGGRRVLDYLRLFINTILRVKPGDILIITGGVGDSAHYRAYNQAEELNLHNLKTSVAIQDSPFILGLADKFKVFVFHRVFYTPGIRRMVLKIKEQKKEVIFDTDDLVFNEKFIQGTDLYKNKMSSITKMQYKGGLGRETLEDTHTKVCTTTTAYLERILEGYGKKVFIVKNKISLHEEEVAENIIKNIPKEKDEYVRIGYFSGTASHNKDFATITDALREVLEKYPKAKLYLAGPLDVESKLNVFQDRITAMPLVPRDRYYENIWKVDINLAPLVKDDPFCEAKSEIKFTEAGILGVPTVAVRNETFSSAISDGVDGFLAESREEWIEKIGKLIEDERLRKEMGEKARKKVLEEYSNKNSHSEEYYQYLRTILKTRA